MMYVFKKVTTCIENVLLIAWLFVLMCAMYVLQKIFPDECIFCDDEECYY